MARADRCLRSAARRSRFSRFLHSGTVFCVPFLRHRVLAPITAGRGRFLRAVSLRQRNVLPCCAHQRRRVSRFAVVSRSGTVACSDGHKNRSSPASRASHFVFSLLRRASRVVSIFPPRRLAIPRGHRARRRAPARPPQTQLTPFCICRNSLRGGGIAIALARPARRSTILWPCP